jgi:hypothetical protein
MQTERYSDMRKSGRVLAAVVVTLSMVLTSLFAGTVLVSADDIQNQNLRSNITIAAESAGKAYDGTPLTASGYSLTFGQLATGDELVSADVSGSRTDAGIGVNTVSNAVILNNGTDVTSQYTITYTTGALMVSPSAVTVTAASASKVYDGTPLTDSSYTVSGLAGNDGLASIVVEGSQTDAGNAANVVTSYTFAEGTAPGNYSVNLVSGTLSVSPAPVVISVSSASKTYDGAPLSNSDYSVSGLVNGDTLSAVISGAQTEAGSSENTAASYTIRNGSRDITGDYSISVVNGTLTVNAPAAAPASDNDNNDENESGNGTSNSGTGSASGSASGTASGTASGSASGTGTSSSAASNSSSTASSAATVSGSTSGTTSGTASASGTSSTASGSAIDSNAVSATVTTVNGNDAADESYTLTTVDNDESVPLASGEDKAGKVNVSLIFWIFGASAAAGCLLYYLNARRREKEMQDICNEISYDDLENKDKK